MKAVGLIFILLFSFMDAFNQSAENFASAWDKEHISKIFPSEVRHKDLQNYLDQLKKLDLKVEEVGRSYGNREIYQIEWGKGPLKIFMWSQMHGDEPTATSALIDMFAYFQRNRKQDWVKKLEQTVTIHAVPMLNPDGAELYQRRNLQSIDINRDAIDLQTPEARLLKKLRDDWSPEIGFNLHNQQSLTTVGRSSFQASIAVLVVYGDAAKTASPGQDRNRRLASMIVTALQKFIPGHVSRYEDDYTATAFGDNFSAWGTPTILIETGALAGKDEMFLVKMNFVAYLTALTALSTGKEKEAATTAYDSLIENGGGNLFNFIFRGATVVEPAETANIFSADFAVNLERRRASYPAPGRIRLIGDLRQYFAIEDYNAAGFYVMPKSKSLKTGDIAELLFFKKDRTIDWAAEDIEKQFPPDAILIGGVWVKGKGVVPKK